MTPPPDAVFGPNVCLSGGATGADLQWGWCAGRIGYSVVHWSFAGHRSLAPAQEIVQLTPQQLAVADPFLHRANHTLRRHFPPTSVHTANLLRRNYYQVAESDAVYAVSTLKNGSVQGGTAWATAMFIDRHDGQACRAYVFCQNVGAWFVWRGHWAALSEPPPRPVGVFAGIGTRDLNPTGKQAIRRMMGVEVSGGAPSTAG